MSNGNGALGPNTLDAFGHGGNYSVSGAQSNGSAAAPPRCLDIFTVDSVAAGNNRRNFAASPTPHLGSLSLQRGSADTANANAPPSYFAATSNSRKLSEGRGREGTATNGSTPKVSGKEAILHARVGNKMEKECMKSDHNLQIYDPNNDDDGDIENNSE